MKIFLLNPERGRPDAFTLLLPPFLAGLLTLSHLPEYAKLMGVFGLLVAGLYGFYMLTARPLVPVEGLLFLAWLVWAQLGLVNAVDTGLHETAAFTILQIWLLVTVVSGICSTGKYFNTVLCAIALSGIIIAYSGYMLGELDAMAARDATDRMTGMTGNANAFAYHMLFVMIAVTWLLEHWKSRMLRILLVLAAGIALSGTLLAGSRKAFLGLICYVLLLAWFRIVARPAGQRAKAIALGLLVVLVSGAGGWIVIEHTLLGSRFESAVEKGEEKRQLMYEEGLEMIADYPLFGVGLNNYRVHSSSGEYSHSDYIEVAASTGVVGFLLYFSVYALLWRRLGRLARHADSDRTRHFVACGRAAILTILLVAAGRPNMTSKITWIFIGALSGAATALEQRAVAGSRRPGGASWRQSLSGGGGKVALTEPAA